MCRERKRERERERERGYIESLVSVCKKGEERKEIEGDRAVPSYGLALSLSLTLPLNVFRMDLGLFVRTSLKGRYILLVMITSLVAAPASGTPNHTHSHTHTYARTTARMHTHVHGARTHARAHAHTRTHTQTPLSPSEAEVEED